MPTEFTPAFPHRTSPLCQIPTPEYINDPRVRAVHAVDTLSRAGQALESLYRDASDEDYGRALLLETIHGAMRHAITLLQPVNAESPD